MIVEALMFILLAAGITFLLLNTYLYKPDSTMNKAIAMNKPETCISMNSASGFGIWRSNIASTLRFFVNISSAGRGLDVVNCETTQTYPGCANPDMPLQCADGSCSDINTMLNRGFLKSIFRVVTGEVEFFFNGGVYTNDQNKSNVGAYLKLITTKPRSDSERTNYVEGLVLPAVPQQKWVMITITKDGKRISVFYDKERVATKVLTYMPTEASTGTNYTCGSTSGEVLGLIGFPNWMKGAQTLEQVKEDHTRLTNTRGIPRALDSIDLSFSNLSLQSINVCPFGNCNPMPASAPANPFVAWSI